MSQSNLAVAGLAARPGEKTAAYVDITIADVAVRLPMFLINGPSAGPTFVLTAGIHGGEYPCVEAAVRLGRTLHPAHLRGQMIIVPSANPIAFARRSIYITPIDGKNLNRQFPGDPEGTFTEAWAFWLFEEIIRRADYYVDLHGGDMIEALVPFVSYNLTGNPAVDAAARAMGQVFGIRYVLEKRNPGNLGGTTYAAAARAGIPALLAEAGGQGVWDEPSVEILRAGVRRVLAHFEMYPGIDDPGEETEVLTGWSWLRAEADGLFYPRVEVGEHVAAGQNLGHVADIFGAVLQPLPSPVSGQILFLVTSLAMNTGDPLMAIAYREEA